MTVSDSFVRRAAALLAALALAGSAACDSTPTLPDQTPVTTTTFFTATLQPGGSTTQTFTIAEASNVGVTYTGAVSPTTRLPLPPTLSLRLGTASGATCTTTQTKDTEPTLVAPIVVPLAAGTYCVQLADTGGLGQAADVTIRVAATAGPIALPTAATTADIIGTNLARGGSSERSFVYSKAGKYELVLSTVVQTDAVLRIGMGVFDGSVCRLHTSVDSAAGTASLIERTIDAGVYCTRVEDIGNLRGVTTFTLTIVRPN